MTRDADRQHVEQLLAAWHANTLPPSTASQVDDCIDCLAPELQRAIFAHMKQAATDPRYGHALDCIVPLMTNRRLLPERGPTSNQLHQVEQ
jgi:hypothetical protein